MDIAQLAHEREAWPLARTAQQSERPEQPARQAVTMANAVAPAFAAARGDALGGKLARAVERRLAGPTLQRKPPKKAPVVRSDTTYTHTSGEFFVPSLDDYGRFTGDDLQLEETVIAHGARYDGEARVKMLWPRLMQAEARRAANSTGGHEVLAVFMVPEWYFKRHGTPWTVDERDRILEGLAMLSVGFPHVLLVPGTLIWRDAQKGEVGNLAPVFYRGKLVLEHEKWNDFGDTKGYSDHVKSEYKQHRPKTIDEAGTSFFQIANVRFAIEVCGDQGRAAAEAARENPFPQGPDAHVHLLVAHGAAPLAAHAPVPIGGYQYSVEALIGHNKKLPWELGEARVSKLRVRTLFEGDTQREAVPHFRREGVKLVKRDDEPQGYPDPYFQYAGKHEIVKT